MLRKRITYLLKTNVEESTVVYGIKIQIPNKPIYYPSRFVVSDSIEETMDIYIRYAYSLIDSLGLSDFINVTRSSFDSVTFDFIAEGDAWGGYGDLNEYAIEDLVYETTGNIVNKYYQNAENDIVKVSTVVYNQGNAETPEQSGINGLSDDNYFIDNDIFISVSPEPQGVSNYLDLTVTDLQTQKSVSTRMYYFNNNTLTFDLSIIIKSLMRKPRANFDYTQLTAYPINTNYGKYKVQIYRYYTPLESNFVNLGTSMDITKTFIRGGVIDHVSNIIISNDSVLRNCEKLPVWQGYPTAEYRLINGEILQVNDLTSVNKEIRPQPDCNAYYFKFKNKKGGYSYWMFNKAKQETSVSNIGYSDVYGEITDFGSNVSRTEEVSGKIPYAFKGLVYDLLTSSETYLYNGGNKWQKVIQKSNKVSDNTNKRVIDVTFKFDKIINYNPTV